ncbi:hypothetical protein SB5439_04970 [Klebsiella variicola]|uniref:type II toxin-antitoxin system prevent-host-death family antitoxin n=1 Tax=Klebsiella variicola TaxID=244366 RepID=UPI00109D59D3|nr:type II toxin-antitoxin system prevent-host-death family antitoxin [Klebsiella variicola]VGQ11593.1 hypothetical protein SB5439_04970 [Klebsiella variicola]
MNTVKATDARAKWAETLEEATKAPVIITRRIGEDMALITRAQLEKYQNMILDAEFDQLIGRHGKSLKALADR